MKKFSLILFCLVACVFSAHAQSTKRGTVKPKPSPTPQQEVISEPPAQTATKRNERPTSDNIKPSATPQPASKPAYVYEFTRPDFMVPYILIEHGEDGHGKISFKMKGSDETEVDPLDLSPTTLEKLKAAFTALNFLDSTETYQTPRDYSTLGNISITYRKEGRERTAKYNWSDNKDAKNLMDEYRRISNQYVWQFDMQIARENQPLNAPSLMDELDNYLRRSEISDPKQMVPLLKELSDDERIPLIARNHAGKIAEKIEKGK
jgi:hypothetical protein